MKKAILLEDRRGRSLSWAEGIHFSEAVTIAKSMSWRINRSMSRTFGRTKGTEWGHTWTEWK